MTRIILLGCLSCFLLTGCGGEDDNASAPVSTPTTAVEDAGGADSADTASEPSQASSATANASEPEVPDNVEESATAAEAETAETAESGTEDESGADVTVEIADWAALQEYVKSQNGRVVVVDLWSTSCVPCRKEFPHLVELHNTRGDQVTCVSFSTDYVGIKSKPPETYKERVLKFLKPQKATFKNFLGNVPAEDIFAELDLASIPAIFVYGPDGKVRKRFDNDDSEYGEEGFTYTDHVVPFVEDVLKEAE